MTAMLLLGLIEAFFKKHTLDEVAARQFVADRACYALRDALVCRVGQGMERGAQPHVIIDG